MTVLTNFQTWREGNIKAREVVGMSIEPVGLQDCTPDQCRDVV